MKLCLLLCVVFLTLMQSECKRADEDSDEHLYFEAKNNKRGRASTNWPMLDTLQANDVKPGTNSAGQITPIADNIKCMDKDGVQSFMASITLPPGFRTVPVFEDAVTINPTVSEECNMKQSSMGSGIFIMKITNFHKCGVSQQRGSDGKEWLTVSIRFAYVGGLRTSEDENILLMCRPQDRTVTQNHPTIRRSNLPKTIFSSQAHELDTKVSLHVKTKGITGYSEELARSSVLEVGQELQFRAVVRRGDGWKFAKLKDLTIQRISKHLKDEDGPLNLFNTRKRTTMNPLASAIAMRNGNKPARADSSTTPDVAYLVLEDGCRNPIYTSIAPKHPFRDTNNPLAINFNFKAFMFQDMADGDTLRVLAKVMACQDQTECQPAQCLDDDKLAYGRRRRSATLSSVINSTSNGHTENFWRDFEFKVTMPGYGQAVALRSSNVPSEARTSIVVDHDQRQPQQQECRSIVIASTCLSIVFVLSTTAAALFALRAKQHHLTSRAQLYHSSNLSGCL